MKLSPAVLTLYGQELAPAHKLWQGVGLLALAGASVGVGLLLWHQPMLLFFLAPFLLAFWQKLLLLLARLTHRPFDVAGHSSLVESWWKSAEALPAVDVYLPVCGEDLSILRQTWEAVREIDYPAFQVWVLDDRGDARVEDMAAEHGFHYLSRPNKGEHAKSGNLEYAFARTTGKYYLVLDADFCPDRDLLRETVPWLEKEPGIGIVQTPQFIDPRLIDRARNPLEYGQATVTEDFYRFSQPMRERLGIAMCVGTSAVYRRAAVEAAGFARAEASEDVKQGLLVMKGGWRVQYLPLILSRGLAPGDLAGCYRQQRRWCHGSWTILTSPLFWNLRLDWLQRLVYLGNLAHYLSQACAPFMIWMLYLLSWLWVHTIYWQNGLWFLPLLIHGLVNRLFRVLPHRYGTSFAGWFNGHVFLHTYLTRILRIPFAWVPTGARARDNVFVSFLGVICVWSLLTWAAGVSALICLWPWLWDGMWLAGFWIAWHLARQLCFVWTLLRLGRAEARDRQSGRKQ